MRKWLKISGVVLMVLWVVSVEWRLLFLYWGEYRLVDLQIAQNRVNDLIFKELSRKHAK